jgi:hypothetical protein
MASRDVIIQRFARMFREETHAPDIDPASFAEYLLRHGVQPPRIPTAREVMARLAKQALKSEIRHDAVTRQAYRAYHAVPTSADPETGQMRFSYIDIDDAPRPAMEKAIALKVSSMVNDGAQVARDATHWNRINPTQIPLDVEAQLDLRDAVEWRLHADDTEDVDDADPIDPSST